MLDILVFAFRFPLVAYTAATLANDAPGAAVDSAGMVVHGDTMEQPGHDVALQSPWNLFPVGCLSNPTGPTLAERLIIDSHYDNLFRMSHDDPGPPDSEQ